MNARSIVSVVGQRAERVGAGRDLQLDAVGDAGASPTPGAPIAVHSSRHVAAEQPAAVGEAARDAQRRVAGERADLDRRPHAEQPRESVRNAPCSGAICIPAIGPSPRVSSMSASCTASGGDAVADEVVGELVREEERLRGNGASAIAGSYLRIAPSKPDTRVRKRLRSADGTMTPRGTLWTHLTRRRAEAATPRRSPRPSSTRKPRARRRRPAPKSRSSSPTTCSPASSRRRSRCPRRSPRAAR